jgi:hypothetical protein
MAERQISVRLAVEGAEQARAQLEAVKAAAREAGEGSAPSATSIRQWESLNRSLDGNYRAAERYSAQMERVRAAEAAGLGTAERHAQLREQAALAYARATDSANTATASMVAANDNAARSSGRLGAALGGAGYQIQDFATQVAMGQNALLAFGVQFAQFAGMFGAAGAIAGAVVTVGLIAVQLLSTRDATAALNDAIKAQDEIYRATTEAGERYRAGLQAEAETLLNLRSAYASYSEARRRVEELRLGDREAELRQAGTGLRDRVLDALPGVPQNLIDMAAARSTRGQGIGGVAEIPDQLRQAITGLMEFRAAAEPSTEALSRLVMQLQDAAAVAGDGPRGLAAQLLASSERLRGLLPDVERWEQSSRQNAAQQEALRLAVDGATGALTSAGNAARNLAERMLQLREIAAANPTLGIQQEAVALQQRLDALRRGGLEAEAAEARAQENNRRVTEAMNKAYEDQLKRLLELNRSRQDAEAGARAAAAQAGQEVMRRNEIADALDRERKALEEVARAARNLGEAYGAVRTSASGLLVLGAADERAITEIQRSLRGSALDAQVQRQAQHQSERERTRLEGDWSRTTDSIVTYAADRFADLWSDTGRGFAGMMQSMLTLARQTFARIAAEAIIRPIVQPIVAGVMGTGGPGGAGLLGGMTQLLGLSGVGSQIGSALGLGGVGAGITGLLSAPLFGQAALASATSSALGAMGGAYGPATAAQLGLGGVTVGSALGALGLGFGAGTLLNSLVGGNQTGGMIGSGGGALAGAVIGSIIPGIGTVLGGLIGGAGGGLLGGMFGGGGKSNREGNATFDFATGEISIGGQSGGKFSQANRDAAAAAAQQVRDLVAGIATAIGGSIASGSFTVGVGDRDGIYGRIAGAELRRYGRDEAGMQALVGDLLRGLVPGITGGLAAELRTALGTSSASTPQAILDVAGWLGSVYRPLTEIQEPLDAFTAQLQALNKTYDDAIARARELGLSEQALNEGRVHAIADLERQRRDAVAPQVTGVVASLADYARGLRVANDNPLNPTARLGLASSQFDADLASALGGDFRAVGRIQGSADALLSLSRDVYGSGGGFAAAFDRVLAGIGSVTDLGDDRLTASALAAETRSQTETLVDALARLQAEVTALRREVQQAGANPLAARAA